MLPPTFSQEKECLTCRPPLAAAQREMRWPRRIMVTGGMQNVHPDDGIDPDGDIPIAYEKVACRTLVDTPLLGTECTCALSRRRLSDKPHHDPPHLHGMEDACSPRQRAASMHIAC